MSDTFIIANQWNCLTEPERSIALQFVATIGTPYPFAIKEVADLQFLAIRGSDWEIYRDMWFANWAIVLVDLEIEDIPIAVYTTFATWPVGVSFCLMAGECGEVTVRCREVRGFP